MADGEKEDYRSLIFNGKEERHIEYKASMSWAENETKMKVVRVSLSFANIKDGGTLVFGVEEDNGSGKCSPKGMEDNHFSEFNQDDVQTYVNKYADPYVELSVVKEEIESKKYVLIIIDQFTEIPVVCKKSGTSVQVGQVYTRPYKKIESVPVSSVSEMREILENAVDIGVRKFLGRIERTGLKVIPQEDEAKKSFDDELGGL